MAPNLWTLLVFTVTQIYLVWAKPTPPQLTCFLVSGLNDKSLHLIYLAHLDDKNLWERNGKPLQNCTSVSTPGLDSCLACLTENERVFARCRLTDPSAQLNFEPYGSMDKLNHIQIPCGSTTTTAPVTSPASPSPEAAYTGPMIGGILGVLFLIAAVCVGVYIYMKKKQSSVNNSSYEPVLKMNGKKEDEEEAPRANGRPVDVALPGSDSQQSNSEII